MKKLSLSFFDLDSDENEENKNSSIPSAPKRQRIDSDSNDNGDIIGLLYFCDLLTPYMIFSNCFAL